jgi:hypothetical protein
VYSENRHMCKQLSMTTVMVARRITGNVNYI